MTGCLDHYQTTRRTSKKRRR